MYNIPFFVIILLSFSLSYAQECFDQKSDIDILSKVRSLNEKKKFEVSEKCFKYYLSKKAHRSNFDLITSYINVLAWQKKENEALVFIKKSDLSVDKKEILRGNVAWYLGRKKRAYSHYMNVHKRSSLTSALKTRLDILKKGMANLRRKIHLEGRSYNETEDQSLYEYEVSFLSDYSEKGSLIFGFQHSKKEFSKENKKSDNIFSIGTYRKLDHHNNISLLIKYNPSFEFSYKRLIKTEYSYTFEKLSLGISAEYRKYSSDDTMIFSIPIYYYYSTGHLQLRVFLPQEGVLLKVVHTLSTKFRGEVWLSGGKTDSSRPYKINSDETSYYSRGVGLTYKLTPKVTLRSSYEKLIEEKYFYEQYLIGIGVEF